MFIATTGLLCAARIDDIQRLGISLLPSDFHVHWYWDQYITLSAPTLKLIRTVTRFKAQTTSVKRIALAFEATEPRERRGGQYRLPGYTRNSLLYIYNIRRLKQEFETDRVVQSSTTAMALEFSDSEDLYISLQPLLK